MKSYHMTLIRHGETAANEQGIYIGSTDYPLTDKSRSYLCSKAEEMVYPKVERVYSSPLVRCTETAEILFPDRELVLEPAFRELDFGAFEGKRAGDLVGDEDYRNWLVGDRYARRPEGESVSELCLRTFQGFHKILLEMMQEDMRHVAIVTHSGVICNALACFGLPKLEPNCIRCAPGEGFELLFTAQMWQQSQAFEILGLSPYLPEESERF